MGPKSKESKQQEIKSLPIIVGLDRKSIGAFAAHMVPKKGHDPHAIKMTGGEVRLTGHNRMMLKSDQEPAVLELLEAV